MKPNFALSLSAESIRLLHRAAGGWRLVGEVSPEAKELISELAMLRKTASSLAPDGVRCKLVIPNGQIRYLSIDTPDMDIAACRDAARAALEGATPYAVDDLAFDISQDGDRTHVAAVAQETLDEAETFAEEHRFHPVSFVAIPDHNPFLGEPYFGPSKAARTLLESGQSVEPDGVAIVVIGDVTVPEGPVVEPAAAETTPADAAHVTDWTDDTATEPRNRLGDALENLRKNSDISADVAAPQVPPIDVPLPPPTFSSRRQPIAPPRPTFVQKPESAMAARGFAESAAAPYTPKPRSVRVPKPNVVAPVKPKPVTDEAERMTVFGARAQMPRKQAPRYTGLILSVALLVVLVGVGAFASGKMPESIAGLFDRTSRADVDTTAIQVSPPIPQSDVSEADPAPTRLDETEFTSLNPNLTDEDAAVLDALRTPLAQDDSASPQPTTTDDLRAQYAVTGIWPIAPDVPSPPPLVDIEDLYVTSIDPIEPAFDAVALPSVEELNRDVALDAPNSPAAAGTKFALDDRGLVVGSSEGALSPDGIKIFAGAPPVRPTSLPERGGPEATEELSPVQTELAAFRPRLRPADIVETTERATLDGLTRSELAEIRPPARPRPPSPETTVASASLVPLEGSAALLSDPNAQGIAASNSRLALAATLRPDARPSNFNQIVQRSQEAAAAAASVATASIAPRAITPNIPSSASVAREATVRNAINLRKVNLIGVYGTPSQRRALVRLANGRYKKVEVGDRIDGGRISAIGEGELRYQKSGRNIVLKMPKG
ncbi:hypothetical protein [uncultured Roseobacter sp.]|uniref:hypothetical protein n=1 Tax=uncultured Roseobacter sp. TaxID=114847 RepID=UPI00260DCC2B|nr:hypothetical protein [uncultured Roseobacter sp.]